MTNSTFQITVLYGTPTSSAAFDEHYRDIHIPLVKKLPGLQQFTVSRPVPDSEGNAPASYLVATLQFADDAAAGAAMSSAEGQATVGDLGNFASGGVTLLQGWAEQIV